MIPVDTAPPAIEWQLPAESRIPLAAEGVRMPAPKELLNQPAPANTPPDAAASYPAPAPCDTTSFGANIQRTMTLLATSTPEKRNTVRILFYGQSITKQNWAKMVADDLRARFPNADLRIENRAIGGFTTPLLAKSAEFDLYPFYPDLVIFYDFGSHYKYEEIISKLQHTTTAEVLIQTEHGFSGDDPADNPKSWQSIMSYKHLPAIASLFNCELCDVRSPWRQYCQENHLKPSQLQMDGIHLNDWGNYLMAQIVTRYLQYKPELATNESKSLVRDYAPGKDLQWNGGTLELAFDGNRVDLLPEPGTAGGTATIQIDGRQPSSFPELYAFTRPNDLPGKDWPWELIPAPIRITALAPLQTEEWTLKIFDFHPQTHTFRFTLSGSVTGADGEGCSTEDFVSSSKRVLIAKEDWWTKASKEGIQPVNEVKWMVRPLFQDRYTTPATLDATRDNAITLAQGLSNKRHVLKLTVPDGQKAPDIKLLRVYTPPAR